MINTIDRKNINNNISIIVENFEILHFDEEPILFSGSNCLGNIIIGSSVDEDCINKTKQFFHVIVNLETYLDFIKRKISYKKILQNNTILLINKSFNNSLINTFFIDFTEIPHDHLPAEDSFCPQCDIVPSFYYDFILHGKDADFHLVSTDRLSQIQEHITELLKIPFNLLKKQIQTSTNIFISAFSSASAYAPGSFKMRFLVKPEIKDEVRNLFIKEDDFAPLLDDYFNYSFNELSNEIESILNNNIDQSPKFNELINNFHVIIDKSGIPVDSEFNDRMKKELINSVDNLDSISQSLEESCSQIEFKNNVNTYIIDENFKRKIENLTKIIEDYNKEIVTDDSPKDYIIYIYHLNIKTRKGNAIVTNDGVMSKPKIKISGVKPLELTDFTKSIHENSLIPVKAIAKKINNKIKSLEVIFD